MLVGAISSAPPAVGCRHQCESALAHRQQLQAAAAQQLGEAFVDAVAAGQAIALPAVDQRRVQRQADPGLVGKLGKCRTQAGGWHLIAAPGRFIGPGRCTQQQAHGEQRMCRTRQWAQAAGHDNRH
ncbi:hypothetical protein PPS11_38724 [Pseudomonas putida S11]|nr:hypothetical protein PPS11_38724 [Pseudomonas putida S11]